MTGEVVSLTAADRWAISRGLPTAEARRAEANLMAAALTKPVMPVRPKFDRATADEALAIALAERDEALAAFSAQGEILDRAEAAEATASRVWEEFSDLDDAVSGHYAAQMRSGEPLGLSLELEDRTKARRASAERLEGVRAARVKIHHDVEAHRAALAQAENIAAGAALAVIRFEGEALAERCNALRREFIATRIELENVASVRLNGTLVTCSPLWLSELHDPIPAPGPSPDGVRDWNRRARNLVGRA